LEGIRLGGDSSELLSQYNNVTDNICIDNGEAGIYLAQYAKYNTVNGNTAAGNDIGIREYDKDSDYNIIIGNASKNNDTGNIDTYGINTIFAGNIL
jgi:parallel beta-helix repeat protein